MDSQIKRGMLDACVLKAVRNRGRSYGYQITRDIQAYIPITESTLYPILRRLENGGLLTVESEAFNGRLRRYYTVTEEGNRRIGQFLEEWQDVLKIYQFVSEGGFEQHEA